MSDEKISNIFLWSIAILELKMFKDTNRVYRVFTSSTEALDDALKCQGTRLNKIEIYDPPTSKV